MLDDSTLYLVILAAGKGTRMKSSKAKVLHEVFYAPMLHHVLRATTALNTTKSIVVIGHQKESVQKSLRDFHVETVVQKEQLGTGHAVLCAEPAIDDMTGCTMILCGDTPLIRPETLSAMASQHCSANATLTVMTTILENPTHYGRIISDKDKNLFSIIEEKDADSEQKKIKEINAGIYCVNTQFLFTHLKNIGTNNSQGEVYLTDIVTEAVTEGLPVHKFINPSSQDVLGVNSRMELSQAHHELQLRRNRELMAAGVTMIQPETIQVSPDAEVGTDVLLHPGVAVSGNSVIGDCCEIHPGALLHNVVLGSSCTVGAYSCLNSCELSAKSTIPPHHRDC